MITMQSFTHAMIYCSALITGEGTFGKVKLAIHLPTGEKVAVKVLEKSRIKQQADIR